MRRMLAFCFLIGVPSLLFAQSPSKSSFVDAAVIQHNGNTGTLTANFPRPLAQAVEAISQEYGWTIDYEDPPYHSPFDLVDVWNFLFDADTNAYWLRPRSATKTETDANGRQVVRFIDYPRN
jgi:hypothetical protein